MQWLWVPPDFLLWASESQNMLGRENDRFSIQRRNSAEGCLQFGTERWAVVQDSLWDGGGGPNIHIYYCTICVSNCLAWHSPAADPWCQMCSPRPFKKNWGNYFHSSPINWKCPSLFTLILNISFLEINCNSLPPTMPVVPHWFEKNLSKLEQIWLQQKWFPHPTPFSWLHIFRACFPRQFYMLQ